MAVESCDTFHDFRFLYAHIRDNRCGNNAKFAKTSKLYTAITLLPFELETHLKKRFVDLD